LCATAGTVTLLNGVATGTDFTNRIGRKVCWKSILMNGVLTPTDATSNVSLARIMLVWDSQPNGALPAITDVLNAAVPTAPMNLNNRDRFRVLLDKRFVLGPYNTTATQSVASNIIREHHMYKKINLETIFDGTTNAIGDIQSGSLFLLTIGNQTSPEGANWTASIRLRFTDA